MRARLICSVVLVATFGTAGCSPSGTCTANCGPGATSGNPATPNPTLPGVDAGVPDPGTGMPGTDGGMTSGCCDMSPANPAGPWPLADLTTYSMASGITEPLIDASPDDAQNLWAISQGTLYVLQPGKSTFKKFTAADGLHIAPFIDPDKNPNTTWLTAMAGGQANQVFVGYYGYETNGNPYLDTEAQKELGNADKVTLDPATGKITALRYFFRCNYESGNGCWEDRSPRHMLFAHAGIAAGHLFIGFNHGVSHVFADQIGDHVHPEIWYHNSDGTVVEKVGEFYGLALAPTGDLWVAGRYGVGLQTWNATPPFKWVDGPFIFAFTTYGTGHSLDVPAGYVEDNSAAALAPDGTLYLASFNRGLASWKPSSGTYKTIAPVTSPGLPGQILDLVADTDGTLWMINGSGLLVRFTPATGAAQTFAGVTGAHRVVIDTTVTPRALYVSMDGGLAVIRAK